MFFLQHPAQSFRVQKENTVLFENKFLRNKSIQRKSEHLKCDQFHFLELIHRIVALEEIIFAIHMHFSHQRLDHIYRTYNFSFFRHFHEFFFCFNPFFLIILLNSVVAKLIIFRQKSNHDYILVAICD